MNADGEDVLLTYRLLVGWAILSVLLLHNRFESGWIGTVDCIMLSPHFSPDVWSIFWSSLDVFLLYHDGAIDLQQRVHDVCLVLAP